MKCSEVKLTNECKSCRVGSENVDCPTAGNEGNTIKYDIPMSTIFDLVPYKNHVGERVMCVCDQDYAKVGETYTIIQQTNEQYCYIRLEEFKQYPYMWFGSSSFKKCKSTYRGTEYTLYLRS